MNQKTLLAIGLSIVAVIVVSAMLYMRSGSEGGTPIVDRAQDGTPRQPPPPGYPGGPGGPGMQPGQPMPPGYPGYPGGAPGMQPAPPPIP